MNLKQAMQLTDAAACWRLFPGVGGPGSPEQSGIFLSAPRVERLWDDGFRLVSLYLSVSSIALQTVGATSMSKTENGTPFVLTSPATGASYLGNLE